MNRLCAPQHDCLQNVLASPKQALLANCHSLFLPTPRGATLAQSLQPWAMSVYFLSPQFWSRWLFLINGIMRHVVFVNWLPSFNVWFLRFICITTYHHNISHFHCPMLHSIVWISNILFIYLVIGLWRFQTFLTIVGNNFININVQLLHGVTFSFCEAIHIKPFKHSIQLSSSPKYSQ